jgi:hypothetical protein
VLECRLRLWQRRFYGQIRDQLGAGNRHIQAIARTCHGAGKTMATAGLALWWMATRAESRALTTALARDRQAQQRLTRPAQFEADAGARRARYIQMEDILEREVRLIPRFHENQWRLARPEVEGLATTFFFPIVNFEELRIRR